MNTNIVETRITLKNGKKAIIEEAFYEFCPEIWDIIKSYAICDKETLKKRLKEKRKLKQRKLEQFKRNILFGTAYYLEERLSYNIGKALEKAVSLKHKKLINEGRNSRNSFHIAFTEVLNNARSDNIKKNGYFILKECRLNAIKNIDFIDTICDYNTFMRDIVLISYAEGAYNTFLRKNHYDFYSPNEKYWETLLSGKLTEEYKYDKIYWEKLLNEIN